MLSNVYCQMKLPLIRKLLLKMTSFCLHHTQLLTSISINIGVAASQNIIQISSLVKMIWIYLQFSDSSVQYVGACHVSFFLLCVVVGFGDLDYLCILQEIYISSNCCTLVKCSEVQRFQLVVVYNNTAFSSKMFCG